MDRTISIEKYKELKGKPYTDMDTATSGELIVECEYCTNFKTHASSYKSTESLNYAIEDHVRVCKKNLVYDIEDAKYSVFQIKGELKDNRGKIIVECVTSREAFNQFFEALYGKDTPEGAYFTIGSYKMSLEKVEK